MIKAYQTPRGFSPARRRIARPMKTIAATRGTIPTA